MGLSTAPLSYESHEEARAAATAAKRKLWRVQGALAALDELESRPELPAREALLVEVEAEVDRAHRGLAELLERTDGGGLLRAAKAAMYEAQGLAEFVRDHAQLRPYAAAVDGEAHDARRRYEQLHAVRLELRDRKRELARQQGRFYALLDLLRAARPDEKNSVAAEQRRAWRAEQLTTSEELSAQRGALSARSAFGREWGLNLGKHKAKARFAAQLGVTSRAEATAHEVHVLEAEATHLRAVSRGALNALAALPPRHEAAKRDLALVTGAVAFLMQVRRAIRRRAILRRAQFGAQFADAAPASLPCSSRRRAPPSRGRRRNCAPRSTRRPSRSPRCRCAQLFGAQFGAILRAILRAIL